MWWGKTWGDGPRWTGLTQFVCILDLLNCEASKHLVLRKRKSGSVTVGLLHDARCITACASRLFTMGNGIKVA